jgi:hypothetical protein
MLNAYCLVAGAMVEVEHEKGTHNRTCRCWYFLTNAEESASV